MKQFPEILIHGLKWQEDSISCHGYTSAESVSFRVIHRESEIVKDWFVIQDSWKIQKLKELWGSDVEKRKRLYSLQRLWFREEKTCQSDKEKQWIRKMWRDWERMGCVYVFLTAVRDLSLHPMSFIRLLFFPVSMIRQATCEKIHVFIRRSLSLFSQATRIQEGNVAVRKCSAGASSLLPSLLHVRVS